MNNSNLDEELKKHIRNILEGKIFMLKGFVNNQQNIKKAGGLFDSFEYM